MDDWALNSSSYLVRIRSYDLNLVPAERVFVDDVAKFNKKAERKQQQREQSKTRSFSRSPPYLTKPPLAASIEIDNAHRTLHKGQLGRFRKESTRPAQGIAYSSKVQRDLRRQSARSHVVSSAEC
jgi:hypothetical protein